MSEFRFPADKVEAGANNSKHLGLNLLTVGDEPENREPDKVVPVARWTLLAGTTAGVTELVFNRLNTTAAKSLADAGAELMTGAVSPAAVDKLTAYSASGLPAEFGITSGALSNKTREAVSRIINATDRVNSATVYRQEAAQRLGLARGGVEAQMSAIAAELGQLQSGSYARANALDIMHSERYGLMAFDVKSGVNAEQLRTLATEAFPHADSTLRQGLLDRASRMVPGETVSPHQAVGDLLPAWNTKLQGLNAENARIGSLTEKLGRYQLATTVPDRVQSILNYRGNGLREPLFPVADPGRAALNELQQSAAAMSAAETALATQTRNLTNLSGDLHRQMRAELVAEQYAVNAFSRGFGKGVLAMSAGIGAGYVIDQLSGEERSTLNSPVAMGLDAGAGLIMASGMPARYKVPLAIATLVVPRVLNAYEMGPSQLAPATLSTGSLWAPNAVDGIGLGVAVGLPVDGRIKAGLAGASIVAGRAYNAYNYKPASKNLLQPY